MHFEQRIDPQLASQINRNEKVLWYGKPDIKCFILEGIFNPLLPFALLWAIIDGAILYGTFFIDSNGKSSGAIFLLGFFAIHLLPVWLYLFGVLTVFSRYKKTSYVVTDYAVYVSGGIITNKFYRKTFEDLSPVNINVGFFDKIIGVGDVVLYPRTIPTMYVNGKRTDDCSIRDIKDYREVYKMIDDLQKNSLNQYKVSYSYLNEDKSSENSSKEFSPYDINYLNKPSSSSTSSDYYSHKMQITNDKENLQTEYFKNLDNNNVDYAVKYQRAYYQSHGDVDYIVNKPRENNKNIKSFFALIKVFVAISVIIFICVFLIAVVANIGGVPKTFSPILASIPTGSKGRINNTKSSEEVQKELISQDFESAKQLYLNKIISEVKNYKLREGITLEEKIKLLHPDIYDTFKWEASQVPVDMTYYFVTVSSPTNPNPYAQTLYRFGYNTVSYNVEAMTSETNNMMTKPYQVPATD